MNEQQKRSFLLYPDLIHTVRKLPPDKAGELFMLILQHVNGEDAQPSDLLLEVAFEPIRQQLTRDIERWQGYRERQAQHGKQGGRPPKNPEKGSLSEERVEKGTLFSERVERLTNNITNNITSNVTNKRESTRAAFAAPSLAEVVAFAETEGIGSVKAPNDFHDYYTSNGWKVGRQSMKDWRAAFRRWTRNEKTFEHGTHKQAPLRGLSARTQSDWDALQEWGRDVEQGRVTLFGGARESEA